MRLDQMLVDQGLCPSRTKAKELVVRGEVSVNGKIATKPSMPVSQTDEIEITNSDLLKYVSRGGLKLETAISQLGLNVSGKKIFDIGQSTGGFTDVVLTQGAEMVVGIDVGHDQLSAALQVNPKVVSFEGVNIKDIFELEVLAPYQEWADIVVADLSFISLSSVFEQVIWPLKRGGELLLLVKPQFQLSKKEIGRGGIVKDPLLYAKVKSQLIETAEKSSIVSIQYLESQLKGRDGNQEFFLYGKKK